MSIPAIIVLTLTILAFVGIGIWALTLGRKYRWPEGKKLKRKSKKGVDILIINPPGETEEEQNRLADACALAVSSLFTVWNKYSPKNIAEKEYSILGIRFITDEEMDKVRVRWGYKTLNAYFSFTSRAFGSGAPTATIKESCASRIIKNGEPVIHEFIHALLGDFDPEEWFDSDHTDEAWTVVRIPAEEEYVFWRSKVA